MTLVSRLINKIKKELQNKKFLYNTILNVLNRLTDFPIPIINKIDSYLLLILLPKDAIELEITHLCNKNCALCDHRIGTSDYKYLKKNEYKFIVSSIEDPKQISEITLIGGEPLVHPYFQWLVRRLIIDFPNAKLTVFTNGRLLPTLSNDIFNELNFILSEYPDWNDDIVRKYRKYPNMLIKRYKGFRNPNEDPDLDEKTAKKVRRKCHFIATIVGTRLYSCPSSEGIERAYKTEPVHAKFDKNWSENLSTLPTWKACQHCFRAMHIMKYASLSPYECKTFDHLDKAQTLPQDGS